LTIEQLVEKLESGYVIARKDLIYTLLKLKETEYERGCENMRHRFALILKRTRAIRESKKLKLYNILLEQISDYAYNEKQKSYYGENLENHPDKRDGGLSKGEIQVRKRSSNQALGRQPSI
jgi:hypothetical protein